MEEHRKTPRVAFQEGLRFRTEDTFVGHGIDISAGGIGAWVPVFLEPDTSVEVELFQGYASVLGTVRWCRPDGEGYRVGVQFSAEDWTVFEMVHDKLREGSA